MTYTTTEKDRVRRIDKMLRKAGIVMQAQLLNLTEVQLQARIPSLKPVHIETIKSILGKQGKALSSEAGNDR